MHKPILASALVSILAAATLAACVPSSSVQATSSNRPAEISRVFGPVSYDGCTFKTVTIDFDVSSPFAPEREIVYAKCEGVSTTSLKYNLGRTSRHVIVAEKMQQKKEAEDYLNAITKLTPDERKALGLKEE